MITLRGIALWQMVGGFLILVATLLAWLSPPSFSLGVVYYVSACLIGLGAMWAGVGLWRGSGSALLASVAVQAIQAANVSLPGIRFGATLGPLLGLNLTPTSIGFTLGFYGRGGILIRPVAISAPFPIQLTINFLAFAAIALLAKEMGRRRALQGEHRPLT